MADIEYEGGTGGERGATPLVRSSVVQALLIASSAIFVLLTGRYWGASARGDLSLAQVGGGVIATLGGLGLVDVLVHAQGRYRDDETASWSTWSLLRVAGAGGIAACILAAAGVGWEVAGAAWATAVLLQANRLAFASRLAQGRLKTFDVIRALPILGPLALAASVVVLGHSPGWGIVPVYLIALVLVTVPLSALEGWSHRVPRQARKLPLELRSLSRQSVLWSFVQTAFARFDVVLVYLIAGSAEAGVYASAVALAEAAGFSSVAMTYHAQRSGALGRALPRRVDLAVTVAALVAGFLLLSWKATDVLGDEFHAVPRLFALYVPAAIGLSLLRPALAFRFGSNTVEGSMRILVIGLGATLLADLLLIPWQGAEAAAAVSSIGYLLTYVVLRHRWERHELR